jgi:2-oxoisovalerate dehydrogenase E2 component (dihydrolipoyl transacylase)
MSEYVFKLPDLGEGTVESEISEWNIKVGDVVTEDAIVGTMMTDKAAVELNSPVTGKVLSLAGEPGDMIAVGAPLVIFETDGDVKEEAPETAPARKQAAPAEETAKQPDAGKPRSAVPNGKVITSPAIRRRAKEAGIDLSTVQGSGTGGRIMRSDFEQVLASTQSGTRTEQPVQTAARTEEIKVIGLRRVIAERMSEANREIPHFAYVEEIDITELEALRQHLNSKKTDASDRLTLLPFLGLALIRALRDFPQCNTTYDKTRNVLIRHGVVHLGVATQTPDGLKVPVVKNADRLSVESLSGEIKRVSAAAKNNAARKDELSGSTITITSLGKLGGIVSTPVINLPEVAIIGVNKAVERPVVVNGQVTVRLMMNLSSSFDHRFVDGYDAAAMIQQIKEMLEHPATIFIA